MMLGGAALNELRIEFNTRKTKDPDGFSLDEFVNLMLEKLGPPDGDTLRFTTELCELFAQIDVNGDGTMEWEEFTSYCVEAGIVATRRVNVPLRFKFVEAESYVDRTSKGPTINKTVWIEEMKRLFVFEGQASVVRLYNHKLELQDEIEMDSREVTALVHSCCYIAEHNLISICSSNLQITFWDATTLAHHSTAYTRAAQSCLCWAPGMDVLYSCGSSDPYISAWKWPDNSLLARFTKHTDIVTDMLAVPHYEVLVTASLDKKIMLWELGGSAHKGTLVGHARGVRQLQYVREHDLLLSAGFDCDALGWDINNRRQILRLRGHRFPLVGIQALIRAGAPAVRGLTCDRGGNFKVWDIARSHTGLAICLQTFTTGSELSRFTPRCFASMAPFGTMVAAGIKMHLFKSQPVVSGESIPVAALYNPTIKKFVVAANKGIKLYNDDGNLEQELYDVCKSPVTYICMDDRQRKLILGTQRGNLVVANFMNGALMKESDDPHEKDVTQIFYVNKDKIMVTASWDHSIAVWDENDPEDVVLLRRIVKAHHADINAVAVSHDLSLIASGASDSTVHVWDFLNLKLDGVCEGHTAEVTAVLFVDPYPVLVTADAAGYIKLWGTRFGRLHDRYRCLFSAQNITVDEAARDTFLTTDGSVAVPITHMQLGVDSDKMAQLLVTADEMGHIKVWDLSSLLEQLRVLPVEEARKPSGRLNYNPHLRTTRHGPSPPTAEQLAAANAAHERRIAGRSGHLGGGSAGGRRRGSSAGLDPVADARRMKARAGLAPADRARRRLSNPDLSDAFEAIAEFRTAKAASEAGSARSGAGASVSGADSRRGSAESAASSWRDGHVVSPAYRTPTSRLSATPASRIKGLTVSPPKPETETTFDGEHEADPGSPSFKRGRSDSHRAGDASQKSVDFGRRSRAVSRGAALETLLSPKSLASRGIERSDSFSSESRMASGDGCVMPLICKWNAHRDSLSSLQVVVDPPSVITCSHDKSVRVWNLKGDPLGVLTLSRADQKKIERQELPPLPRWTFSVDEAAREAARIDEATAVLKLIEQEEEEEKARKAEEEAKKEEMRQWEAQHVHDIDNAARPRLSKKKKRAESASSGRRARSTAPMSPTSALSSEKDVDTEDAADAGAGKKPPAYSRHERAAVLSEIARKEFSDSDDDIVVEDDVITVGSLDDDEEDTGPQRGTKGHKAALEVTLAAAVASGKRKTLDARYNALTEEKARKTFSHTGVAMRKVDLVPSGFLATKLGLKEENGWAAPSRRKLGATLKRITRPDTAPGSSAAASLAASRPSSGRGRESASVHYFSVPAEGDEPGDGRRTRGGASRAPSVHSTVFAPTSGKPSRPGSSQWWGSRPTTGASGLPPGVGMEAAPRRLEPLRAAVPTQSAPNGSDGGGIAESHAIARRASAAGIDIDVGAPALGALANSISEKQAALDAQLDALARNARGDAFLSHVNSVIGTGRVSKGPVPVQPGAPQGGGQGGDGQLGDRRGVHLTLAHSASAPGGLDDMPRTAPAGRAGLSATGGAGDYGARRPLTLAGSDPRYSAAARYKDLASTTSTMTRARERLTEALLEDDSDELSTASGTLHHRRPRMSRPRRSPLSTPHKFLKHRAQTPGDPTKNSLTFGAYTTNDVIELKNLFDSFDVDGSGAIDVKEFAGSTAWQASSFPGLAGSMFESIDADGSGEITLDELVRVVFPLANEKDVADMVEWATMRKHHAAPKTTRKLPADKERELREIFKLFDKNNDGKVTLSELWRSMKPSWGEFLSEPDLRLMVQDAGLDMREPLSADDFVRLLKDTV